jgi:D-glycero-D-manno-heptose 1,7-bisphosphate phosphatase
MKLLILDRDGVVNQAPSEGSSYILNSYDLKINLNILEIILEFQKLGGNAAVASNQQCVGRGLISEKELSSIHSKINATLIQMGGEPMIFFVCPHLAKISCDCRKPAPGLLFSALSKFKITFDNCIFIGDQITDELAAKRANVSYIDVDSIFLELENYSGRKIASRLWAMDFSDK